MKPGASAVSREVPNAMLLKMKFPWESEVVAPAASPPDAVRISFTPDTGDPCGSVIRPRTLANGSACRKPGRLKKSVRQIVAQMGTFGAIRNRPLRWNAAWLLMHFSLHSRNTRGSKMKPYE